MAEVVHLADFRSTAEPWVKKRDIARHFGMSERWVELRMREGLPHWKSRRGRGAVRFRLSEVESWLREERGA